jgi:hypothetical protein
MVIFRFKKRKRNKFEQKDAPKIDYLSIQISERGRIQHVKVLDFCN